MSHRKMHLALSLALILCGLFNSIFCQVKQRSKWSIYPVSSWEVSPVHHKIEAGNKAFAHKLFKTLLMEHPRKNIIFSPLSISASFAMLSLGTRSTTLTNLLEGLGFDLKVIKVWDVHHGFQSVIQMLKQLNRAGHLMHRDMLFIDSNRKINSPFLWDTQAMYDVRARMIDFRDVVKTKKQINHFVAEKTHKRTKELITSLNPHTFLFLVDYVFFKGTWEMAFHSNLMHKEDFFVDKHTTVPVDMIWKTGQMIYSRSEELFATMVKIPFVGNMSIVLVLPDVGQPDSAVKEIVVQRATLLQSSNMRWVHIIMPKFKISSKIDLKKILPKMGISNVFTTGANFSGITKEDFPTIFEAMHEATMEVSKEGKMDTSKDMDSRNTIACHTYTATPLVVKFNRPFFLFVEDWMTQRAILMGKVFNPIAE
ncbi:uteroferrin-associated basic protein 2-like [Canis lupus baileyi]|uniref:Serpin domain-containing protein n=5 Tax=Canis lupus TaxID=9612 RepID=A0A8C0MUA7_CANLF|nr:uteroferrin-associated basic protein 2 [Canis lupus familiaris]XP_035575910.1 uteroferrin-associated basic protein 2-like [Canis lupus dingo]XP_038399982.1 uteroferrin-associated basic protein 2 [Canis lupus familiaris]XP_038528907.1 uteroferrin-associated basic protein 2 [Canis lupus familiaris]|eukprot:XP_022278201.1 uteroferrin-associated basic protein 2 [Canis lupus familiaris]